MWKRVSRNTRLCLCEVCGQAGHWGRKCPEPRSKERPSGAEWHRKGYLT